MHLRRRLKTARGYGTDAAAVGHQLHPHTQRRVRAGPWLAADALPHLPLQQQHQALVRAGNGAIEAAHQALQQGSGDVVRDVGHHLVGRGQLNRQHIAWGEAEPRLAAKTLLQALHQIAIKLHRCHRRRRRGQQPLGERSPTRPHLQQPIGGLELCGRHDAAEYPLIHQPVLAETLAGTVSSKTHG